MAYTTVKPKESPARKRFFLLSGWDFKQEWFMLDSKTLKNGAIYVWFAWVTGDY